MEDEKIPLTSPLPKLHTYIGVCCREWVLAYGGHGRCGICGTVPVYVRDDTLEDGGIESS